MDRFTQERNPRTEADAAVSVRGFSLSNPVMPLVEGWNLCGPATSVPDPYNENIQGEILWWDGGEDRKQSTVISRQYRFVPRSGTEGVLQPGKGYWINSKTSQNYLLSR